ncbi:phosphonopyruvate decarboxylase [Pseudodesulfovibrio sp. zrk46]|uniref:phosphonopyruvate decarboxylase n=1 Tax=Pseudodesulfovibrio sp. zrk46 TaxID=2725288 RepID=UPI00144A09F6|nr:phosphonopyruvate decarboxylase [Pseudodesulfovibrio sp. zrk46]QJB57414.1 phosphonopyruvate decarboxylase [Pseudodesulfovibrio sp. zrk46]
MKPDLFLKVLNENGIGAFYGVPDSTLKHFCAHLTGQVSQKKHLICANEGAAIGMAIGYHLATGEIPVVYMQNSGLGNSVNPLLSLGDPDVYSIPTLLIIGWRGEPGKKDEPQHKKQGRVTLELLESMEIPFSILDNNDAYVSEVVATATGWMKENNAPYALVIKKGTFDSVASLHFDEKAYAMTRETAIDQILEAVEDDSIVVSTTGMASREVFELREKKGEAHHKDFLTVGGMGHCSQIAMGIAMQKPDRQVICIDGDGAAIMHMGSMASIGAARLSNLTHIVMNNGVHDSVGGQPNASRNVTLTGIATACGYSSVGPVDTPQALKSAIQDAGSAQCSCFLEVFVRRGHRPELGRPTQTPIENKKAFMEYVR